MTLNFTLLVELSLIKIASSLKTMSHLMMMVIRYAGGIHQCICTHIREVKGDGAGNTEETYYYPIQYNWVDNLVYMGREVIGIEYLNVEKEVGATNPVLLCVL